MSLNNKDHEDFNIMFNAEFFPFKINKSIDLFETCILDPPICLFMFITLKGNITSSVHIVTSY